MWTWNSLGHNPHYLINQALRFLLLAIVGSGIFLKPALADVGLLPTPVLQGVQVQADTSFDLGTQRYTYTYTISNPAINTGEIWSIEIDVTNQSPQSATAPVSDTSGLTIPLGGRLIPFDQKLANLQPLALPAGTTVIPFGQQVPAGWNGGLSVDGLASFSTATGTPHILPGFNLTGFQLISPGLPTIRKVNVLPFWVLLVDSFEHVTPEMDKAAEEIERAIIFHTVTLGPSLVLPGSFGHWNQLRDDLNQAIQLGWVPDAALATTLVNQLTAARQALDNSDGTQAKARLNTLIQTITQSTTIQRRQEVFKLILLNAQRLIENTPNTVFPFEPKLKLSPQSSTLPLGTRYTLTATVINLGDPANPPVSGFRLGFQVVEGPQGGQELRGVTDAQGDGELQLYRHPSGDRQDHSRVRRRGDL